MSSHPLDGPTSCSMEIPVVRVPIANPAYDSALYRSRPEPRIGYPQPVRSGLIHRSRRFQHLAGGDDGAQINLYSHTHSTVMDAAGSCSPRKYRFPCWLPQQTPCGYVANAHQHLEPAAPASTGSRAVRARYWHPGRADRIEAINPLRWHSPGAIFGLAWQFPRPPALQGLISPVSARRWRPATPKAAVFSRIRRFLGQSAPGAFGRKRCAQRGTAAGPVPHHCGIMRTRYARASWSG